MNNSDGSLNFQALLDSGNYDATIERMKRQTRSFTNDISQETASLGKSFSNLGVTIAAAFTFQKASQFVSEIVKVRGEFQQLTIAFETMLGSKSKADALIAQITQTAATTPFSLQEVAQGAKQLVAYGTSAEEVNGTLVRLGNIASGLSVPLNDLIYLYGTSATQGRLMTQDLNQFAGRGVPIYSELAKVLGVTKDKVKDLASEGKIGFDSLQKVVANLTDQSGMFYNLMEKQSKSLSGKISNLGDAWDQMLNKIGESSEGALSGGIGILQTMVENYQTILDVLEVLIITYGAYRAALILNMIAEKANLIVKNAQIVAEIAQSAGLGRNITLLTLKAGALSIATGAQNAFNNSMLANPAVLTMAALAGLTAIIYKFATATDAAEDATKNLQNAETEHLATAKQKKDEVINLISVIKNQNLTYEQQSEALKTLKQITNGRLNQLTLEAIKTGQATSAINDYVAALDAEAKAKARQDVKTDNYKKIEQLKQQQRELADAGKSSILTQSLYTVFNGGFKSVGSGTFGQYLDNQISALEDQNKQLDSEDRQRLEFDAKRSGSQKQAIIKNKEYYETERKRRVEELGLLSDDKSNASAAKKLQAEIAVIDRRLSFYDTKTGGGGIAKKDNEKDLKTWQDVLNEKKKQYENYKNAIDNGYEDSSKKQYGPLLKEGENYIAFLKNQIAPLEKSLKSGSGLNLGDFERLNTLTLELNKAMGIKSPMEQFNDNLTAIKENASGTSEYISDLQKVIDELNNTPIDRRDADWFQKFNSASEQSKIAIKDQANALSQFLQELSGSKQQIDSVRRKYQALRDAAAGDSGAINSINKAEQKEIADIQYQNSEGFKKLNEVIVGGGISALDKYIANLKADLQSATENYGKASNEVKAKQNDLLRAQEQRTQLVAEGWNVVANAIGQVGGELQGLDEILGSIGSLFAGAYNGAQKLISTLANKNYKASSGEATAAGAQATGDLVGLVVGSIKKKKAARAQRELDAINFQISMNKALNDEIRLRTILSENVYFKDYAGRIKDSIGAATDALTKYNDALVNLMDNGKALTGTKNTIDWGNVGSGAMTGAGAGAIIGSSINPGIGTAIGAVVGALVGGVAGLIATATKSIYGSLFEKYPQLIQANGELNKSLAQTLIDTNQLDEKTKLWLGDLINAADALEAAKAQITEIVSELTGGLGSELRDTLVKAFEDGADAAEAFSQTVEKTLNNMLSNLIFSAVFKNVFDTLESQLNNALAIYGATGNLSGVLDSFKNFTEGSKEDIELFNELLRQAQEAGKKAGLNLFGNTDGKSNPNSLSGAIKGVTEQTANVLSGQLNAIRINQAASLNIMTIQLPNLSHIERHTRYLVSIDRRLALAYNQSLTPYGIEKP